MLTLIVNADDFGLSRGVNFGIIDSYLNGIVNSTTMMMNMPGTQHALQLAKEHPGLRVGVHLVLTSGQPLLENVRTLVNEEGRFKTQAQIMASVSDLSQVEIEREWSAQIERFLASGLKPTHLDSHHHVHTRKEFEHVVRRLSSKYKLPVRRNGYSSIHGVETFSDVSLFDFYGEGVCSAYFANLVSRFEDGTMIEVMCHPAYLDPYLLKNSSYHYKRVEEYEILTSVQLPEGMVLL